MQLLLAATLVLHLGAATPPALPLVFEANHGQADGDVRFVARRPGTDLLLAPDQAVLLVGGPAPRALRIRFDGAAADPVMEGEGALAGRVSYLVGADPRRWRTGLPLFARVAYRRLYPSIDLVVRAGAGEAIEYDFHVLPGGDPARIGLRLEGAAALSIDERGDLVVGTGTGVLVQHRPVAYQERDGARREVAARFVLRGPDLVGFEVGAHDPARPLVIDPPLAYSTYLGGDGVDHVNAIALDGEGKVYVTGETTSLAGLDPLDFPILNPIPGGEQLDDYAYPPPSPRPFPSIRKYDAFVGKLDTSQSGASSLVYMTFLGGGLGDERAFAIAVDGAGRAHVAGTTSSHDFPLQHPLQTCLDGQGTFVCDLNMSFLARLSPSGSALEYGSFLNGSNVDVAEALAVGPGGRLYVGGRTASPVGPSLPVLPGSSSYHFYFPITAGALQQTNHGVFDAFLTVLDLDAATQAQQLVYSTLLGGCADDEIFDLAVDPQGLAAVTGGTQAPCASLTTRLPIRNAFQPSYGGGLADGFVARVDPAVLGAFDPANPAAATGLVFSTFLGGSYDENDLRKGGVAQGAAGELVVAGTSSSANFPTTPGVGQRCPAMSSQNSATYPCDPATGQFAGGVLPPNGAILDGTIVILSPSGQLLAGSYVGGPGQDSVVDLDVRQDGAFAYLAGTTSSTGMGSTCAPQPQLALGRDAFAATVKLPGLSLAWFTYLGGGSDDFGNAIAYDEASGSVFVGGYATYNTTSKAFPTTASALQPSQPGSPSLGFDNGFLAEIARPAGCGPDLVIRKFGAPDPLASGCGLTYTIEVQNLGVQTATQVTVTDPMPAGLTLGSATPSQGSCAGAATVVCDLGSLAPGALATIVLGADLSADYAPTQPPLVNTATVTGLEPDVDPASNSASWTTHVQAPSDGDGDGASDCSDGCPDDPQKSAPGLCGCGNVDFPALAVSSPSLVEGNAGASDAAFAVSLAQPSCVDLWFTYATEAGTADAGVDFAPAAGSFAILAGDTGHDVPVAVLGDLLVEPDETFGLGVVLDANGASIAAAGTATILNDDQPPVVALAGPAVVDEGQPALYTFGVTAGGPFTVPGADCAGGSLVGAVDAVADPPGGSFTCVFPDGPAVGQASVQVESGGAASNLATVAVTVVNVAPAASLSGPTIVDEGTVAGYAFVVSDPGSDGFAVSGDPDCGPAGLYVPGSLSAGAGGGSFDCLFPDGDAAGAVAVALADSDGAAAAPATLDVTVHNVAPTVVLDGETTPLEGDTVAYTLAVHDPGDAAVTLDTPDCGPGGGLVAGSLQVWPAQGPGDLVAEGSFLCTFPSGPATSTVSLRAFDEAGPGPLAELQVLIGDDPPLLSLSGPALVDEGQAAVFSFSVDAGSDGFAVAPGFPDCDVVAGSLVLGAAGGSFACLFPDGPSLAAVRLQVIDGDGKPSDIAALDVTVANAAPVAALTGPSQVGSGATATFQLAVADAGGDAFALAASSPSCGAAGALVPGSLSLTPSGGSFQCVFATGPASSLVSVAVVDEDGAIGNLATLGVTIAAPVAQSGGWMTGNGDVVDPALGSVHFAFSLSCTVGQGPKNLHLMWGSHKLKLDQLLGTTCSDAPAIDPGLPAAGFDTLAGTGVGRVDGVSGYGVAFTFTDAGEPGSGDGVDVTITDAQGNLVLHLAGLVAQGNNDAQI